MRLSTTIKFAIQRGLRSFGWEFKRLALGDMDQLNGFLTQHGVTTVLDVGANIGQFSTTLRQAGYKGRIISFEPQSQAYASLVRAAAADPLWDVAPRCAVGAVQGELELNLSNNSVSSSALPILKEHTGSAPDSRYVGKEKVPVITLDSCQLFGRDSKIFLKVDTQGYEQQVLDGATTLLKTLGGVQLEMSLAPLYEGQADFVRLIDQMQRSGFYIWALNPGFTNRENGRLLQTDGTFFRTKA